MEDIPELSRGHFFELGVEGSLPTKVLSAPFSLEGWVIWLGGSGSLLRDDAGDGPVSLGHDHDGMLAWSVGSGSASTARSIASLGDEWHHFVVACGAEWSHFYVDGDEVGTIEMNEPALAPPLVLMRGVEGFVADVAVYAEMLTAQRVRRHWEAGRARTI